METIDQFFPTPGLPGGKLQRIKPRSGKGQTAAQAHTWRELGGQVW